MPAARASTSTRTPARRSIAAWPPKHRATNAAVAATAGQIVLYAGKPAITYFFASSGGMTESVQNSFLGAEPEPWLRASPTPTTPASPQMEAQPKLPGRRGACWRGSSREASAGIEVLKRGVSPRIVQARVLGSRGDGTVSGPELAATARAQLDLGLLLRPETASRSRREPDHSGQPKTAAPAPAPAPGGERRRRCLRAPAGAEQPRPARAAARPRADASGPRPRIGSRTSVHSARKDSCLAVRGRSTGSCAPAVPSVCWRLRRASWRRPSLRPAGRSAPPRRSPGCEAPPPGSSRPS